MKMKILFNESPFNISESQAKKIFKSYEKSSNYFIGFFFLIFNFLFGDSSFEIPTRNNY